MSFLAAVFGASVGVAGQMAVNTLQKLPVYIRPWETIAMAGIGAYAGKWLSQHNQRSRTEHEVIVEKYKLASVASDFAEKASAKQKAEH